MTVKPSVFDGIKVNSEAQRIELLSIENSSQNEYCETPEDIKNSEAVKKLLSIINRKANYTLETKPKNSNLNDIYERFTKNLPITLKQLNYFRDFLSTDDLLDEAQKIVSKLLILKGEKNSAFIDSFLTDGEGKFIIDNFINYLSVQIENYNLVIDIEDESSIKLVSNTKEGDYYTYKSNGKTGIFIVSDGEIFMLKKLFEDVNLLNNGLIFCRVENKSSGITELGTNGFSGLLYDFDGSDFKLMEKLPGTIDARNTEKENLFITSSNLIGFGLTEIAKWEMEPDKLGVEVTELLGPGYNNIRFQGKFIKASRKYSESEYIYDIYIYNDDGIELAYTTKSDLSMGLRDLGDNYYLIETTYGKSILKLDNHNVFNAVDNRLLDMQHTNIGSLMKGDPVMINHNNETGIYVFEKTTGKLTKLIDATNINLNSPEMDGDMMTISTEYGKEIFFYKNGKLYEFSKGYSLHTGYIYGYLKKGFFGEKFFIKPSFDYMANYLTEVRTPLRLKTK